MSGDVPDDRQAKFFAVVSLDDRNEPGAKSADHDGEVEDDTEEPPDERHRTENQAEDNVRRVNHDERCCQQQALQTVKSNELVLVVRLKQKEDNRRNDRDVGDRAQDIVVGDGGRWS